MLASRQAQEPLLKKENHEYIERKSFPGADSYGRGADWPGRAQLRYLFATAQDRIVFIGTPMDDHIANLVIAQLLFLQMEDSKKDINIYINSPGGSVTAGLPL